MMRIGLLSALLLCACGQEAGRAGQNESPPTAGSPKQGAAALPDYLPDYPGSTRVEVANLGVAGTDSRSGNAVAMETADTPLQVAQFYRTRFAEQGVPVRVDTVNEQGGLLSVGRDGERGAMLTISSRPGGTRIAIIRGRAG
jgi:hypothetical protein